MIALQAPDGKRILREYRVDISDGAIELQPSGRPQRDIALEALALRRPAVRQIADPAGRGGQLDVAPVDVEGRQVEQHEIAQELRFDAHFIIDKGVRLARGGCSAERDVWA